MANPARLSTAHLDVEDCWRLLESANLGRLALRSSDGDPDIFPVNYIAYRRAVYIRSAHDIKLFRLASRPFAAFEIDGEDEQTRWSVELRGHAARLRDETEIELSGVTQLATASPRPKPYVIKLTPDTVTGRRFPRPSEPATQVDVHHDPV
jgi:nitroimidazol reductase NimA-like FMN-containing flavoprotein (pyridoxamine 5'-phosphate oxidase superfamily)